MKRRSREINTFSLSAIDLFACATGAFLLLALILLQYKSKEEPKPPVPPQPTPLPTPVPPPPTPAPTPVEGFKIQVPLGVSIEWKERGIDIDMYVEHNGDFVFFGQPVKPWGILTKDETRSDREVNREVFFVPRFDQTVSEGVYRVYVAYYSGGSSPGPYEVSGRLVAFPGTPNEETFPFRINLRRDHRGAPGRGTLPVAIEFQVELPRGASAQRDEDFRVRVR